MPAFDTRTDFSLTSCAPSRKFERLRRVLSIRALLVSFASFLTVCSVSVEAIDDFADNFDASHNYSGGNVSGTIWNGMLLNSGFVGTQNATLITADANITNAGQFTVTMQNGGWDANSDNGFALYRNVTGDFVATVQVTGATIQDYNDLGLMARVANSADAGVGEDYLLLRYFAAFGYMGTRSVNDNVQDDFGFAGGMRPYLKLQRFGNILTCTMANDSAFTQNILTRSVTRDDFAGLPLQVGIWNAGFTSTVNTARLDNFRLSVVPEPSSLYLAVLGFAAVSIVAKKNGHSHFLFSRSAIASPEHSLSVSCR